MSRLTLLQFLWWWNAAGFIKCSVNYVLPSCSIKILGLWPFWHSILSCALTPQNIHPLLFCGMLANTIWLLDNHFPNESTETIAHTSTLLNQHISNTVSTKTEHLKRCKAVVLNDTSLHRYAYHPSSMDGWVGKMYHAVAQERSKHALSVVFVHDGFRDFDSTYSTASGHAYTCMSEEHISACFSHTHTHRCPLARLSERQDKRKSLLTGACKPVR